MKKYFVFLFCSLIAFCSFAQTDSLFNNKSFRFQTQVGFNATQFIKQFIVLNSNTIPTVNPFDFNVKFLMGTLKAPNLLTGLRFGYGYRNTHNYSNTNLQDNERSDDSRNRALRIGLELQHIVSKRLIVYLGVDYVNILSYQSTVTNFGGPFSNGRTEIITTDKSTGFGPVLGMQFNLNKWISFSTEASFYMMESRGGTKTISSNSLNDSETFNDSRTEQIMLPLFVNCNFMF